MQLPLEIRYKIYSILLARLFPGRHLHLHQSSITGGVRFVVNDSPYSPSRPEGDCYYGLRVVGGPGDRTVDDCISTNDEFYRRDVLETHRAVRAVEEKRRTGGDGGNDDVEEYQFQSTSLESSHPPFLCGRSEEEDSCSGFDSGSDSSFEADAEYDKYDTDGEIRKCPISDMDVPLHQDPAAVSVTIPRMMDPEPECNPRWHDPDYDYYLFEDPAGPYPHEEDFVGDIDDCMCYYRTPNDYRAVSELSRVSSQFTAELGSVLWANATIEILEPAVFGVLARTRPAALGFVASVVLHLACYGDFCDTQVEMVRGVCDFFNASVTENPRSRKLRSFTVVLSMTKPTGGGTTSTGTSMGTDDAVYSFGATAEARMAELAVVFRTLEMADGASFHVRFGRGLPPAFPTWNDQGTRDLRAVMGRITVDIREAWMPACIVREKNNPGTRSSV